MTEFLYRVLALFTSFLVMFTGAFASSKQKKTDFSQCKNVIFFIGDGMGFNSIKMAEQYLGKNLDSFDSFTLNGESKTDSASGPLFVTDSAAGGSALATGVRISLKSVGVYPSDIDAEKSYPMNLAELAVSQGKSAGIVTTAKTFDATPAAFSAHVSYREKSQEIHRQQSDSDLTLLWGMRDKNLDLDYTKSKGFNIIWNEKDMNALEPGCRSFGQFGYNFYFDNEEKNQPTFSEMTAKAIDLLDDDEDGFFLMVEAAHIDKCSDKMDEEGMSKVMDAFDKAIKTALDYAEENGDTMVLVTADHETGGIIKLGGKYVYTSTWHTDQNVPLLVYGCDDFIKNGEAIENCEVGRRTACVMGENNFPIEIKK
ncbi:MAG: alkaline phosphatase [Clostridia bacterium]|nr:alkaline phosphatase [Clostridia bacterium]